MIDCNNTVVRDSDCWSDKSLPLSGLLILSQRVNRRTLRVYSFHSGIARWSLLRYTVPNRAPIDIYFFVNHCYHCVSLGCLGCLVLPVNAWFALRQPKLRSTFGQKLKLWLLPTPWNNLPFLVSLWHILLWESIACHAAIVSAKSLFSNWLGGCSATGYLITNCVRCCSCSIPSVIWWRLLFLEHRTWRTLIGVLLDFIVSCICCILWDRIFVVCDLFRQWWSYELWSRLVIQSSWLNARD